MDGYIKLYRSLLDWEWFDDEKTLKVWLYILLMARFSDQKYKGTEVPRGSFVTTIKDMSKKLNMSERSVRTAINHLKSTNELTSKTTNKYTLISVVKYQEFQGDEGCYDISSDKQSDKQNDKQSDKQVTNNRQTTDKQLTNQKNKNVKNVNNINNITTTTSIGELLEDADYEILEQKLKPGELLDVIDEADKQDIRHVNNPIRYLLGIAKKKGYL